jgi:citrate synthase
MTTTTNDFRPGLEGVVAAETRLSHADGQRGELVIAGFPLEELAGRATFEEAVYLLWHDHLPTKDEVTGFAADLCALRPLPEATVHLLQEVAAKSVPPMDALLMGAATLNLDSPATAEQQALTILARLPTIVATYWRLCHGQEPIAADPELSHAANYLYMLTGETPHAAQTRALDTYLNTVIDHGLNASTFTARVIIATESDLVSAVVGALGALKGPLHGGAPGPALDMVFEIGSADRAEAYLRAKLDRGERLMGFGHRVYKVRDPRADVLSVAAEKLFQEAGDSSLYDLAKAVEQKSIDLLAVYKPGRNLQTNVEFFTALVLHGLGLDTDLFTPTFAISRAAGWIAHCFEQKATGRLIRPSSRYIGEMDREWQPVEIRD